MLYTWATPMTFSPRLVGVTRNLPGFPLYLRFYLDESFRPNSQLCGWYLRLRILTTGLCVTIFVLFVFTSLPAPSLSLYYFY